MPALFGCFGQSLLPTLPHSQPIILSLARTLANIVSLYHPTPRGPLTEPPEPILMLITRQPLRATLLQLTPTTRTCRFTSTTLILSCALRTMAARPSLQAAEDFLSFVNASPTRMSLPASPALGPIDVRVSIPCCEVG